MVDFVSNDVLLDMLNKFLFVYLDDILIFLRPLLENKLFKAEKCKFHISTVSFLGFTVQHGQFSPDPAKVKGVAEWPTPSSQL